MKRCLGVALSTGVPAAGANHTPPLHRASVVSQNLPCAVTHQNALMKETLETSAHHSEF